MEISHMIPFEKFKIQVDSTDKSKKYFAFLLAVVKNSMDIVKMILLNPSADIDMVDDETGVNAFWLAAYYGHGDMLCLLAE